jgi:ribosomal protein L7/L12
MIEMLPMFLQLLGGGHARRGMSMTRALMLNAKIVRRKIHAIKAYREATGADLKEAKEAIDDLAQEFGG